MLARRGQGSRAPPPCLPGRCCRRAGRGFHGPLGAGSVIRWGFRSTLTPTVTAFGGWGKVHPRIFEVTPPWLLPSGPARAAIVPNKGSMTNPRSQGPCCEIVGISVGARSLISTLLFLTVYIFGGLENEFDLFQFEISLKVILPALGPC